MFSIYMEQNTKKVNINIRENKTQNIKTQKKMVKVKLVLEYITF